MDQILQGIRRTIIILVDSCKIHYYHVAIIIMLLCTKLDCFKEGWIWEQPFPTKLLATPIRATIILLSVIHKFPSYPDENVKHVLIIYIQIANTIMCIAHFRFICAYSPEYCYEYPLIGGQDNVATQLMFFAFQVTITINMVIVIWYIKSIRRVIMAAIIKVIIFLSYNFLGLMGLGNVVLIVALINMQDVVIAGLIIFILLKIAIDTFLVDPFIDFMALDISMLSEEPDEDDREGVMNPPRNYDVHVNGLQFRDALELNG